MVNAIERIVRGEASVSGAVKDPLISYDEHFPLTRNDEQATRRTTAALGNVFGQQIIDPGPISGSEDVGVLATAAGVPLVFWFLGGADPSLAEALASTGRLPEDIPSNHSPHFAPLIRPTLSLGIDALVAAAREWLIMGR